MEWVETYTWTRLRVDIFYLPHWTGPTGRRWVEQQPARWLDMIMGHITNSEQGKPLSILAVIPTLWYRPALDAMKSAIG